MLINTTLFTAQEIPSFIKDFFSKREKIYRKLRIWSDLLKKSLMENLFCFCFCFLFFFCFCFFFFCSVCNERKAKSIQLLPYITFTAIELKFFFKDFLSKRDQIRLFWRIWLHLLRKSLLEKIILYAVVKEKEFEKSFACLGKDFTLSMTCGTIKTEMKFEKLEYILTIDKTLRRSRYKIEIVHRYIFSKLKWHFSIYNIPDT